MGKLQLHTSVLELKKIWDPNDSSLVIYGTEKFSPLGYTKYWEAVDRMIKYCDTTTLFKLATKEFNTKGKEQIGHNMKLLDEHRDKNYRNEQNDRFHWHAANHNWRGQSHHLAHHWKY